MESYCTRDCAVALAKLHGKQTILMSVYMDINKPVVSAALERALDMVNSKNLPLIMGIDSNAHSCLYGPDSNARGDQVEDMIITYGL